MDNERGRRFHLEINSLEDFLQFAAMLRGEELDPAKVAQLTARLKAANDTEAQTVEANTPTP